MNKLSAGMWIVGKDIEPGKYKVHLTYPREYGGTINILTSILPINHTFYQVKKLKTLELKNLRLN